MTTTTGPQAEGAVRSQDGAPGGAQDGPAVEDWLCLALHRASRAMTATYRPLLAPLDLTYPQYLVLSVLLEEGEATVGRLGERVGLESSTLSPLLRRLEGRGLLTRTRGDADERRVVVALTPAGRELRERASDVPTKVCQRTTLPPAEMARLVGELRELVTALGA